MTPMAIFRIPPVKTKVVTTASSFHMKRPMNKAIAYPEVAIKRTSKIIMNNSHVMFFKNGAMALLLIAMTPNKLSKWCELRCEGLSDLTLCNFIYYDP